MIFFLVWIKKYPKKERNTRNINCPRGKSYFSLDEVEPLR